MMRFLLPMAAFVLLLAGCAKQDQATAEPASASTTSASDKKVAAPDGSPVAYRNAQGQLLCPVMNAPVKSEEDAVGFQDYEGTRYYFCCGACPDKFKADPAKYAKK
jgi:YHS domain-containing protein